MTINARKNRKRLSGYFDPDNPEIGVLCWDEDGVRVLCNFYPDSSRGISSVKIAEYAGSNGNMYFVTSKYDEFQ
jgi:hypothetical protein